MHQFKKEIFNGKILHKKDILSSYVLKDFVYLFLEKKLCTKDLQTFEKKVSPEKFHQLFSEIKEELTKNLTIKKRIANLLKEFNYKIETTYIDNLRLRCVTSYLHTIDNAKPAFAIHRDTWYANPETQINFWIPIFSVDEKDTFAFYPEYFDKPIQNDSNLFHLENWNLSGGFQANPKFETQRIFPEAKVDLPQTSELKIPMQAGELLIFSASHLHGTRPNQTNKTRFSIDFRVIDTSDLSGAPNIDNFSKGSILSQMWRLSDII
ncbi:MAG TPA: phytanoyl-CoA dioxygenase family protein [Leptospiraceae bacterium]|nr:phytanoyl-CoA dioxygenase family protein [Leptospiraceae bacterium]HMW07860.1 phytanoyl-CoA dioxygenase family protein [Leptospiraceae bacterium]HMX32346.1 phytanoyl-CoA dioxygenase family protein [Leptospiraceae bacterium]HMY32665.1 phytanoyl-CoA dioxygenase family protein [Leptospiraceae bacterium]HMZ66039.1 phytanoyl-CoA dioxygenase family protein [Leptospiraceae bacterium]